MPKSKRSACSPKSAVAYARYSSAGQRDVSIDQQLADIRAYARREGYTIVHEYADHAKSGYKNTSARAEFQQMLADARNGGFDTVIAWKVDRFGRNRQDSAIYKGQLREYGIRVVYAMEPIPTGAAGVLTEGMLESIAEWYSVNLSENVRRGMNDNARKCLHNGVRTYGYLNCPDGKYAVNPDEASIVQKVFADYISGHSAAVIANDLTSAGIMSASGKPFTLSGILRMVGNERYKGVYFWNNIRVPGGMPVIINETDWEKAQEMKKKMSRHIEKSPVEFLLTGKLFCGLCGKPMVGDSGKSKTGTVYYYYSCSGHKTRGGAPRTCDKKSERKEAIEKAVLDFIYDKCLDGPLGEKIVDALMDAQKQMKDHSPRAAVEKELKETNKKIDNINDAIAAGIWNSSTAEKLKSLEDAAAALQASLTELQYTESQLYDRKRLLFFLHRMADFERDDPVKVKHLINTFINAVFVYDDELRIVINAVEGVQTVSLEDVKGSDNAPFGLPNMIRPNSAAIVFRIGK